VKAVINIPLNKKEAVKAKKAIETEDIRTDRVKTKLKATSKGLEIIINAKDLTSMRAALNTTLKHYRVHKEVKKCLK
jgi:tRNA threonylcarbamoyladenosine modification (KEOPS) complex  Pcc1 subunit